MRADYMSLYSHGGGDALHYPLVIPGRRASAGPGIQIQALCVLLDSGFALSARPGMTNEKRIVSPQGHCRA
jgi:hypothetical protein